MKALVLTAAISLPAFAQVAPTVELPPEVAAKCAEEGGCALVSRDRMTEVMRAVAEKAYEAGKKESVEGACRNTKDQS